MAESDFSFIMNYSLLLLLFLLLYYLYQFIYNRNEHKGEVYIIELEMSTFEAFMSQKVIILLQLPEYHNMSQNIFVS